MPETSINPEASTSETDIPTGLNRIKTRRVLSNGNSSSKTENSTNSGDSHSFRGSRTHLKQKLRSLVQGHATSKGSNEGIRKGRKISHWFTSHIFKDPGQAFGNVSPNTHFSDPKVKALDKDFNTRKLPKVGKNCSGKQSSLQNTNGTMKWPKALKSFSHELGPKGGIKAAQLRAHSYNDLKELLGALRSRFDAAKEVVNTELGCFMQEVMEMLKKSDSLTSEGQKTTEDLLILAQQCIEMTSLDFRTKCEAIVQDISEKRKLCQAGLLKLLLTRMLFILTRCTRLLHFERDSEPIDEKSLFKFKECLEKIPSFETSWILNQESSDSDSGYALKHQRNVQHKLQGETQAPIVPQKAWSKPQVEDSMAKDKISTSQNSKIISSSNPKQLYQDDDHYPGEYIDKHGRCSLNEQGESSDGSDLVICRICEELVPATQLESHSYICAYADKCDLKCSGVDERLVKFAEILEQIIESRNLSVQATYDSPENSRMQTSNSSIASESCSPKISEWRSKGVEGMFEDLHEMDTASMEDSHFAHMRAHWGIKLGHCGPPSSAGSMTSASSTNTPRAGNFDFFWLEHNNPSEVEDVQQMKDLVDIARCVADTDISEEGSYEYLLACMQELQDVLRHSKLKAFVIDTFGGRLENLLREKSLLACEVVSTSTSKNDITHPKSFNSMLDYSSQSSTTVSTPVYKERTNIDDFEIIKPISRGAYGKVFLARKRTTGDLFAIKVLKKLDMLRKNDIERIVAERNILITVRNPFVVRFFYSFTSKDNLYLVMEYLNGGDLYSLLRKVGCLEEDVARIYIAELVLALEYLHSLGIVHRDLKPDNILIAHDGHIKLTDFGLSKIGLMNSTDELSGTETKEINLLDPHSQQNTQNLDRSQRSAVGTPDYLAPEILLGTEHGYAADWWSVGIILFELVTGIPPFSAEHPEIIFDNILNRKIPWPPVPRDMSSEAQDLIDRFLIHDPSQRLGADGSSEVKSHCFFKGVNWDTLALQKAAFVPQPDSVEDTSYFVPRYTHNSNGTPDEPNSSDSASNSTDSVSNSGLERMDEYNNLTEFESSPLDLSLINFSFKNLSQLASINRDVLLQSGKDQSKNSSPYKALTP